ncbi:MAG: type IV toxin-antitoxin system AbiEi family antitoxin domain-containing protein [Acidimicrobiia bacterium]|nr:type IV toxin-antitoxin system AbiEi family antitoxin domain-containing protein [Acidimicrobiia bacterium]
MDRTHSLPPTPDEAARRLVSRQHGLLRTRDLIGCGLSADQIEHRACAGSLVRLTRGVYAVGGAPPGWRRDALAACFAAGADALASHLTAVALHGLGSAPVLPHVLVPLSQSARTRIARVHRSAVHPADRRRIDGVPVTSLPRTLVDVAGIVDRSTLTAYVDEILCARRTSTEEIDAAIKRCGRKGRAGAGNLPAVIAVWTEAIEPGSPAEVRFLRSLLDWGVEGAVTQHEVRDANGEPRRSPRRRHPLPQTRMGVRQRPLAQPSHLGPRRATPRAPRRSRLAHRPRRQDRSAPQQHPPPRQHPGRPRRLRKPEAGDDLVRCAHPALRAPRAGPRARAQQPGRAGGRVPSVAEWGSGRPARAPTGQRAQTRPHAGSTLAARRGALAARPSGVYAPTRDRCTDPFLCPVRAQTSRWRPRLGMAHGARSCPLDGASVRAPTRGPCGRSLLRRHHARSPGSYRHRGDVAPMGVEPGIARQPAFPTRARNASGADTCWGLACRSAWVSPWRRPRWGRRRG